jgi:hypothetical protein
MVVVVVVVVVVVLFNESRIGLCATGSKKLSSRYLNEVPAVSHCQAQGRVNWAQTKMTRDCMMLAQCTQLYVNHV